MALANLSELKIDGSLFRSGPEAPFVWVYKNSQGFERKKWYLSTGKPFPVTYGQFKADSVQLVIGIKEKPNATEEIELIFNFHIGIRNNGTLHTLHTIPEFRDGRKARRYIFNAAAIKLLERAPVPPLPDEFSVDYATFLADGTFYRELMLALGEGQG